MINKVKKCIQKFDDLKLFYKILVLIIGLIIMGLFEFLFTNYQIFKTEIKGKYQLDDVLKISENIDDKNNKEYYILLSRKYVDKLYFEFDSDDDFNAIVKSNQENKFGRLDVNENEYIVFHELGNYYQNIKTKVEDIRIVVPENVSIENVSIINNIEFNTYLFALTSVIYLILCYLFLNKNNIKEKLHILALIVILGFGSIIILSSSSVVGFSWDDQIHFYSMIHTLDFKTSRVTEAEDLVSNLRINFHSFKTKEEIHEIEKYLNKIDKNVVINNYSSSDFAFSSFSYLPGYLMYKLLTILNISFSLKLKIVKLLYLIIYGLITSYAIKIVKKYKQLFFTIAIIPTAVFIASNFSYDTLINCCLLLSFAYFINIMDSKKANKKDIMIFIICTIFGSLSKAIYGPILLLLLIIPKEKFNNKKQCLIFKGLVLLLTLMLLGTFILPTIFHPENIADIRGGDTSASRQINIILKNPLSFAYMFIHTIFDQFFIKFFPQSGLVSFSYYGDKPSYNSFIFMMIVLLIAYLSCCNESEKKNHKELILIMFILFLIISFIWGALYLSFTPVGLYEINGVQSRYFIPLIFPLIYIFVTPKISCKTNDKLLIMISIFMIIYIYINLFINLIMPYTY